MSEINSDSDSDFEIEEKEENNNNNNEENLNGLKEISTSRKRKANEIYQEMIKEDNKHIENKMNKVYYKYQTNENENEKKKRKISIEMKRKQKKLSQLLKQIFGKNNSIESNNHQKKNSSTSISTSTTGRSNEDIRKLALESVKSVKRDRIIVETKKFAGQSIQVERNVKAGDFPTTTENVETKSQEISSLDKVLNDLKGPQTISTVTKSSYDWEGYKTAEGIEEEVANATKEGYLTRKDFLERCDYRQFELERDERLAKLVNRK